METGKKDKISILIPAYNVEKYIAETLESVRKQTFTNWECIVVNDASSDSTPQIIKEFVEKDNRFILINSSRNGVAEAKNLAITKATGEYVVFIDSDDWVDDIYLETLYSHITKYDADLVQCGFYLDYPKSRKRKPLVNEKVFLDKKGALLDLTGEGKLQSFLVSKIYRRDKISPCMPQGKVYEDMFAITSWVRNMDKIMLIPVSIYHYRQRKGSIMHSDFYKNKMDYMDAISNRAEIVHSECPEDFDLFHKNLFMMRNAVAAAKIISRKEIDPAKRREGVRKISSMIKDLQIPDNVTLKNKERRRIKLLKNNPDYFRGLLHFLSYFASIHHHSFKKLYD